MPPDVSPDGANAGFTDQTVRQIAHVSLGGGRLRVRLSNVFGDRPLQVGAVHLALHAAGSAIVPGSDHELHFQGHAAILIPAGAIALSDPVDMSVTVMADLAISLYLPGATGPLTWHQLGSQTTYAATGDQTAASDLAAATPSTSLYVLAGVDVVAAPSTRLLVTLGDSITDGFGSTRDAAHRWPDILYRRLRGRRPRPAVAIVNQGISGNRLLHDTIGPSALARFDRDVLGQPGVTQVIVLEGINDIGLPNWLKRPGEAVSSEDLEGALAQLVERAHERGIRICGGTLTPFDNSGEPYFSAEGERMRLALNEWIRGRAGFDGVIDFDRALRDPAHPSRLLPAFDSGDHLHPNDAGYEAMAAAVDQAALPACAN